MSLQQKIEYFEKTKIRGRNRTYKKKIALDRELLQNKLKSKIRYFTQSTIADLA